ncbi:MAG TPA: DUF2917 domain-containing protein [Macromonas sp.]|nr:DUF2917 domain-containing protein [Macromonas sp.]
MSQTSLPAGQFLGAGQTLACYTRPGTLLRVRSGRLWLTQSGDPADHFLVAGDTFRVGSGRVVLQADTPQHARYDWVRPNGLQRLRMAASRYMTWRAMSLTMSR